MGLFVTVEGPSGVGKSTLVRLLASQLTHLGFDVLETTEPTASSLGQFIRQAEEDYKELVFAYLVAADRRDHLQREVLPALTQGKLVLSDRYIESSLVLQRLDGVAPDVVWGLNDNIRIPDLSIILTAPVDVLKKRVLGRGIAKRVVRRIERTNPRTTQMQYYLEAATLLSNHGFNVLVIENAAVDLTQQVTRLVNEIQLLVESEEERPFQRAKVVGR